MKPENGLQVALSAHREFLNIKDAIIVAILLGPDWRYLAFGQNDEVFLSVCKTKATNFEFGEFELF